MHEGFREEEEEGGGRELIATNENSFVAIVLFERGWISDFLDPEESEKRPWGEREEEEEEKEEEEEGVREQEGGNCVRKEFDSICRRCCEEKETSPAFIVVTLKKLREVRRNYCPPLERFPLRFPSLVN